MSINHIALTLGMEKITQKWLLYGCNEGFYDLNGAMGWLGTMILDEDHAIDEVTLENVERNLSPTAEDGYHQRQVSYRNYGVMFNQWRSVLLVSAVVRHVD